MSAPHPTFLVSVPPPPPPRQQRTPTPPRAQRSARPSASMSVDRGPAYELGARFSRSTSHTSPSSTDPLQSSSRPLHASPVGAGALHAPHAPAEQRCVPLPHALEHARDKPSSIVPSQSSSRPLHVSV